MTKFQVIYDAFLAKETEDEWVNWTQQEREAEWFQLLLGALPYFKFPRVSLEMDNEGFVHDLSNVEIQLIATYMKCEWLNRTILDWKNVKPLFEERDFSQANLLDKFTNLLEREEAKAKRLEEGYYRSINYQPFDYSQLAD